MKFAAIESFGGILFKNHKSIGTVADDILLMIKEWNKPFNKATGVLWNIRYK